MSIIVRFLRADLAVTVCACGVASRGGVSRLSPLTSHSGQRISNSTASLLSVSLLSLISHIYVTPTTQVAGPHISLRGLMYSQYSLRHFLSLRDGEVGATWFKLRLIITISGSARWLLRAVNRYHWDTRTVEFDLSRALFLS